MYLHFSLQTANQSVPCIEIDKDFYGSLLLIAQGCVPTGIGLLYTTLHYIFHFSLCLLSLNYDNI